MKGFYIYLPVKALDALDELAAREWRTPRDQAAVLLLAALRSAGALTETTDTTPTQKPAEAAA